LPAKATPVRFEKKEVSDKLTSDLLQKDVQIKMLKIQNSESTRKTKAMETKLEKSEVALKA
jgi:hypothetical protein